MLKNIQFGSRILLGLIYGVFGAMGLAMALGLMTMPQLAMPEKAIALVILAPITLHIVLLHALLTPGVNNLILPGLMVVLHVLAISGYWNLYRPLFGRGK